MEGKFEPDTHQQVYLLLASRRQCAPKQGICGRCSAGRPCLPILTPAKEDPGSGEKVVGELQLIFHRRCRKK